MAAEFGDVSGLAVMFIGVMYGYALDLLQARVPFTFKYNVLSDVPQELLIYRNSKKSEFLSHPVPRTRNRLRRLTKR